MILFISPKTSYITKRMIDEAMRANVAIENFSIRELADRDFDVDINRYDTLYIRFCYPYFKETTALAKKFIAAGKKVVDAGIAQGDVGLGKMPVYEKLSAAKLPVPKTEWFLKAKEWQYPCIAKWIYGFGGKEVFLIKNIGDLRRAAELIPPEELLIQEFVPAEFEYKIITVGYKSLPVILRFKIDQKNWRPDFTRSDVIPSPSISGEESLISNIKGSPRSSSDALGRDGADSLVFLAEQSARLLGRELAKVDILESRGKFYILEVNRWPGLKSFEQLTGYNAVKDFLAYLI